MHYRRAISIFVVPLLSVLCTGPAAFAQQLPPPQSAPSAQQTPAPSVAPAIPSYPDSSAGLEKLMKDMLELERHGDTNALAPYLQALVLPDSDVWFKVTFGNKWGGKLDENYETLRPDFLKKMSSALNSLVEKGNGVFEVVTFDGSCRSQATQQEFPLLLLHRKKFPLYSVRFTQSADGSSLNMFAFVDGAFRYIGNLPGKINQLAQSADAQQKVVLTGTIGEDGVLRHVARSSGPCWLEDLAIKVIQQYHYSPTVLLGKPVEVHTTITVIFSQGG